MLLETGLDAGSTVRRGKWVKNSQVSVKFFMAAAPEAIHGNVQLCTILGVSSFIIAACQLGIDNMVKRDTTVMHV